MKIVAMLVAASLAAGCASAPVWDESVVRILHVENFSNEEVTIYTENPYARLGTVTSERDFALPDNAIQTGTLALSISRIGRGKVRLGDTPASPRDRRYDLVISQNNVTFGLVK
jgi:hypothetical protein